MTARCDTLLVRMSFPAHLLLAAAAMTVAGCSDDAAMQPGDVRTYTVPRSADVAATAPRRDPPITATPASRVRFDLPEGWIDGGASGLRLATLFIGDGDTKQEVTVIPASGTLESNIARWVGQLDASADETDRQQAAAAAIADASRIDVDGTEATVVLLLDPAATAGNEAGEAILGAMVPLDGGSSLFVKFKGRADVARREQENFHRFVSSLRWN